MDDVLIDGLARIETNKVCGVSFPALPKMENGFVLLAHAAFHLRSGQLGLRQVIDWMMYVHSCLDDTAWNSGFQEVARKYGLEKLAITLTYLCKEWLGLPDRVSYIQNADMILAKELLNDVLSDGNFGRRKGSAQAVERVSNNVRKVGFFQYLQTAGLGKWKATKRFPVLRPFAWIYYLCCWAKKGKHLVLKPLIIREEYEAGKKLYNLNKQLGLYDLS